MSELGKNRKNEKDIGSSLAKTFEVNLKKIIKGIINLLSKE